MHNFISNVFLYFLLIYSCIIYQSRTTRWLLDYDEFSTSWPWCCWRQISNTRGGNRELDQRIRLHWFLNVLMAGRFWIIHSKYALSIVSNLTKLYIWYTIVTAVDWNSIIPSHYSLNYLSKKSLYIRNSKLKNFITE